MTLLLDTQVNTVNEVRNKSFYKWVNRDAINAIATDLNPFALYCFQTDEPTLVGSYNEGTSGVLGNMAWTNIGLRGPGWYVWPVPGAQGFGMTNDGGASGFVGSVVAHSGNAVNGADKLTVMATFWADNAGEGGNGRIIDKDNGYRLRFSAANTIIFEVWDGAAWRGSDTGANVEYNTWQQLVCVYDGTLAAANRIKMYLNGFDVTVAGANIPTTITDDGNVLYVLDNTGNNGAWDGLLGTLATIPSVAFSQAQAQSFCEIRGLFQATVVDQPPILTPGHYSGYPEYDFIPNDHMFTTNVNNLKTQQGTSFLWFSPDDFTADDILFSYSVDGIIDDEYNVRFSGGVAGDPIDIFFNLGGVGQWNGRLPVNLLNSQINFLALTSDGSTVRGYINGEEQTITDIAGVNSGQWFGDATNADVFTIAALRRNVVTGVYNGKMQKYRQYDRPLSPIEIQRAWQLGPKIW